MDENLGHFLSKISLTYGIFSSPELHVPLSFDYGIHE